MLEIPEEIKSLYRQDSVKKNFRIHFPNGEHEDITNSNIEAESVSFTESLCSQQSLKFGLCEASQLEFTTRNVGNIKGCEIEAYLEIDISSIDSSEIPTSEIVTWSDGRKAYVIPYGVFTVDSCKRQTESTKRKVVAYTKEVEWDTIPNPVEKAKFDGTINTAQNSKYNYNIFAHAYANVYSKYSDTYFVDKDIYELAEDSYFSSYQFTSTKMVKIPQQSAYIPKYQLKVEIRAKRYAIKSDNVDALYEFRYKTLDVTVSSNVKSRIEAILKNSKYSFAVDSYLGGSSNTFMKIFEDRINQISLLVYMYGSVNSITAEIDIRNNHYIYPYIGYTDTELTSVINSQGYISAIKVPYKVIITLEEYSANDAGYLVTTTLIDNEKIIIRDNEEEFKISIITNFPKVYYSFNRKKHVFSPERYDGKVVGYSLQDTDISIYDFLVGTIEIMGLFGKTNRYGMFKLVNVSSNFGIFPSEDLYPSEELYPDGPNGGVIGRSYYESAWYDDEYTKPYDRVSVTYKNENEEEVYAEYVLVDTESEEYRKEDYQEYSLNDNYLIQNCTFTEEQIQEILAQVAENIKDVQYMPVDVDLKGMPWIEPGDAVTIVTRDSGIETLVLSRTLNGIQSLKDNFESR